MAGECLPIDAVESELGPKPVGPLEIIEQAPHEVPTYVHTIVKRPSYPTQDLGYIGDALGIVLGGDPTLCKEHRYAGHRRGSSGTMLDSLRPVFVTHLGDGHSRLVGSLALGTEVHARIALDPDEVVPLGSSKEPVLQNLAGRFEHAFPARFGHHLVHGQGQAYAEFAGPRPQGVDAPTVCSHHGFVNRQVAN